MLTFSELKERRENFSEIYKTKKPETIDFKLLSEF